MFVNLHAHTGLGSPYDAFGQPIDHINTSLELGLNTIAITEHGNMNSFGKFVLGMKQKEEEGYKVKPIYGIEAYGIVSIDRWQKAYDQLNSWKQSKKIKKVKVTQELSNDETDLLMGNETGWIPTSKEIDIKELREVESVVKGRFHIVLWAMNPQGLKNLFTLVSLSHTKPYFYKFPRMDLKLLNQYNEGIMASSACLNGVIGNYMFKDHLDIEERLKLMHTTNKWLLKIFGDRWYNEVQINGLERQKVLNSFIEQSANKFGIPIILTLDSHFPKRENWDTREMYRRMRWLRSSSDADLTLPKFEELEYHLYIHNEDMIINDMNGKYGFLKIEEEKLKKYIDNTNLVAERVEKFYPDMNVKLPSFLVAEGIDVNEELRKQAYEGLERRGLEGNKEYIDRIEKELDVIKYRDFSRYFLTMAKITQKAQAERLWGFGRGSASGSLVAYCLNITDVDPIQFDLSFERFMTYKSKGYPDIDFDVDSPADFKESLKKEWGDNKIAYISNWNKFQIKNLLKDIAKFNKIPFEEVNNVTKVLASEIDEKVKELKEEEELEEEFEAKVELDNLKLSDTYNKFIEKYPEVEKYLSSLLGEVRDVSTHAGGVIIGDDLYSEIPLIRKKDKMQTPFPESGSERVLEALGYIKFDILGLITLTMINKTIKKILEKQGNENVTFKDIKEFYVKRMSATSLDFDDMKVWETVFHKGKWIGIFQMNSESIKTLSKQIRPTSILELATISAINRPAPMKANVHIDYVLVKNGEKKERYIHEYHKEVLGKTYGFLIFQEQLAELVHKLGKDIEIDDAHLVRKLLTSKDEEKKKEAMKYENKFLEGCAEKGIELEEAKKLWEEIVFFSGYGFNLSHAISYAILSFQSAWLLTYYPEEWISSYLTLRMEKSAQTVKEAISEVQKGGYKIQMPSIDEPNFEWRVDEKHKVIYAPLKIIKAIGDRSIQALREVGTENLHSISDFLWDRKVSKADLNKRVFINLLKSGALDRILSEEEEFNNANKIIKTLEIIGNKKNTRQKFKQIYDELGNLKDFSYKERIKNQFDLTNIFPYSDLISEGAIDLLSEKVQAGSLTEYISVVEYKTLHSEKIPKLKIWFIVKSHIVRTGKNGKYAKIQAIDNLGTEQTIFVWSVNKSRFFKEFGLYSAEVRYSPKWGISISSDVEIDYYGDLDD